MTQEVQTHGEQEGLRELQAQWQSLSGASSSRVEDSECPCTLPICFLGSAHIFKSISGSLIYASACYFQTAASYPGYQQLRVGRGRRTQLWPCRICSKSVVRSHGVFMCLVQGRNKSCPSRAEGGHVLMALAEKWESLGLITTWVILSPCLSMCLRHRVSQFYKHV